MVKTESGTVGRFQLTNRMVYFVGGSLFIVFIAFFASSLAGPAIGNVFSDITSSLIVPPDASGYGNTAAGRIIPEVPSRVIIREGYLALIVEDTRAATDAIRTIVAEMETEGAFVVTSEEAVDIDSQVLAANMTIRVPAAYFDPIMDRLAALAVRVEKRRETAEDVTEEYVDIQGRLAAMEVARDRLRRFLSEAETVEEMLLVEQKLAEREAEIESLMGRLKYLADSAHLSRVEISMRPSVLSTPVAALWRPGDTALMALAGLVKSLQTAVDILIYFGIGLLPWLAVGGLIAYGIWRMARRFRARRSMEKVVDPASRVSPD